MSSPNDSTQVLVVDDQPAMVKIITRILELNAVTYEVFVDPELALARIQSGVPFAILFADYKLSSELSGSDLVRAAQQVDPAIRCILTSGNVGAIDTDGMAPLPELLQKPFSMHELKAVLAIT